MRIRYLVPTLILGLVGIAHADETSLSIERYRALLPIFWERVEALGDRIGKQKQRIEDQGKKIEAARSRAVLDHLKLTVQTTTLRKRYDVVRAKRMKRHRELIRDVCEVLREPGRFEFCE